MYEFRTRVSEDGRIVIPALCRKELGLVPGEEVVMRIKNSELHLLSLKYSLKKAQMLVQQHAKNKSLVKTLTLMRQKDLQNE